MRRPGIRNRVADRAPEVAPGGNLDQRQAAMLFVVRAQATVPRTAEVPPGVASQWRRGGHIQPAAFSPVGAVISHEDLLPAVFGTEFLQEHLPGFDYYFGINLLKTLRAQADRKLREFRKRISTSFFPGWRIYWKTAAARIVSAPQGISDSSQTGKLNGA